MGPPRPRVLYLMCRVRSWGSGPGPGRTRRNEGRRQAFGFIKGFKAALGGRGEIKVVTQGAFSEFITRKRISYEPGSGECIEMEP